MFKKIRENISAEIAGYFLFIFTAVLILSYQFIVRDIWYDEAFTGIVTRLDFGEFTEKVFKDVHPPIYYFLVKAWGSVFSFSATSIRVFSLVAHLVSIPLVFYFLRKTDKVVQYTSTTIFAVSPFFIGYATEARMYSLLGLFVLVAAVFFQKATESKTMEFNKYYLWFGVFSSLSFLTHYFGLLAVVAFLVLLSDKFGWKKALNKEFLIFNLKVFAPLIISILTWVYVIIWQINNSRYGVDWIPSVDFEVFPLTLYAFLFGVELGDAGVPEINDYAGFPNYMAVFIAFILLVGFNLKNFGKDVVLKKLAVLISVPFAIVFLLSKFGPINLYVERYFLPFGIFIITLFVYLIVKTLKKEITLVLLFMYFTAVVSFSFSFNPNQDFSNLVDTVDKNYSENQVVFTGPFNFTIGRFYFGEETRLYNYYNPEENFNGWQVIGDKFADKDLEVLEDDAILIFDHEVENPEKLEKIEQVDKFYIYKQR